MYRLVNIKDSDHRVYFFIHIILSVHKHYFPDNTTYIDQLSAQKHTTFCVKNELKM